MTYDNGRLPPTIILTLGRITIIITAYDNQVDFGEEAAFINITIITTTYCVQVDFDEEAASKACANSGSPDHMNRFEFMKFGKVVVNVMMII